MRKFLPILSLCGVASILPAHALEVPKESKFDGRIQYIAYNANDIVQIRAYEGLSMVLVFGEGEEILDVTSGFTQGWDFVNRRNMLYVKPKSVKASGSNTQNAMQPEPGKWDTNLFVTTNKHLYAFDLFLSSDKTRITYRVKFKYPEEEAEKKKSASQEKIMQKQLDQKSPPANWQYTMQIGENASDIAPTMAYDDGRFTYLKFPNNVAFPTIFVLDDDNKESIIDSHVESTSASGAKDTLVIHRVVKRLVLRLDNKVIGVFNEQYAQEGIAPQHGTTVPGIVRDLKKVEQANGK